MANHPSHYSCEALEGLTIVYKKGEETVDNFPNKHKHPGGDEGRAHAAHSLGDRPVIVKSETDWEWPAGLTASQFDD